MHSLLHAVVHEMFLEYLELGNLPIVLLLLLFLALELLVVQESLSLFFAFSQLLVLLHLLRKIAFEFYTCNRVGGHLTGFLILVSARLLLILSIIFDFISAMVRISDLLNDHFALLLFFFETFQFLIPFELIVLNTSQSIVDGHVSVLIEFLASLSDFSFHFFAPLFLDLFLFGGLFSKLQHLLNLLRLNLISTLDFIFLNLEELDTILHLRQLPLFFFS